MTTRISFRMPDDDVHFTDEALASWAGKTVDVTLLGQKIGDAFILEARNYVDPLLGPGVWVEAESAPAVPFTIQRVDEVRIYPLDDQGRVIWPLLDEFLQRPLSTGVESVSMIPDTDTPEGVEDFTDEEQAAIIEEVPVPDDPYIPQPSQDPDDRAVDAEDSA